MAEDYCAHPECNCELEPGKGISRGSENYCSEYCANRAASSADECECGHADCE
jgi:Prokaryotic metallothionein